MELLDSKQEVIKTELTRYGKKLLSEGKFKPVYYSFSDEDITYDIVFASGTESQSDVGNRIYEETPLSSFKKGSFTSIEKKTILDSTEYRKRETTLGTIMGNTQSGSSINFNLIHGTQDSVTTIQRGYYQCTSSIQYEVQYYGKKDLVEDSNTLYVLDSGEKIYIKDDYIIFQIEETNTEFLNENYDIKIRDVDTNEILNFSGNRYETDKDKVEYWLEVYTDKNIPEEIICKNKNNFKTNDVFRDKMFKCKDIKKADVHNPDYDDLGQFKGIC